MKTAIFQTDFWKDDKIYQLNSDTRQFYLCILTSPERNTTRAYKYSRRMFSAYTGYSSDLLQTLEEQLQEKEMVYFVSGYIIIGEDGFTQPSKGKLTQQIYEKDISSLPKEVLDFIEDLESKKGKLFQSDSGATPVYNNNIKNNNKNNNNIYTVDQKEVAEVINQFGIHVDPKNKRYYGNKTQRDACEFLITEYGYENVISVIQVLKQMQAQDEYFPSITTPCELRDKWVKALHAMNRKKMKVVGEKKKQMVL